MNTVKNEKEDENQRHRGGDSKRQRGGGKIESELNTYEK
jgi:hypothetical protein